MSSTNTIPTRELGRSGLRVSALGLGCMGMSFAFGNRGDLTDEHCIAVIHTAYKMGINFFDTALIYGPHTNEVLLGKAISTLPRDKLVIATKFGLEMSGEGEMTHNAKPDNIRASIQGSLERLGTDYVDLYYLHRVDPEVPIEDVARTMLELKAEGKIRHWGLSEVDADTIRKAHAICPLTAVQSEYSIIHRLPEKDVFPVLEELGIGFVPYGPLGHGFLTATITSADQFAEDDVRRSISRYSTENIQANAPIVDLVKEYAEKKGVTPAQIALAWVIAQKPYIAPIPGTTKLHRLEENIGAVSVVFSAEEMADFNQRLSSLHVHGER